MEDLNARTSVGFDVVRAVDVGERVDDGLGGWWAEKKRGGGGGNGWGLGSSYEGYDYCVIGK